MNKYSKLLAEKNSISRLCVDREKMETKDILGEELTILDCDVAEDVTVAGEQTTFSIYVFKEYPDKYVYGGLKLTNIAKDIVQIAENEKISVEKMDIHVMLKSIRLKNNNDFTDVVFM